MMKCFSKRAFQGLILTILLAGLWGCGLGEGIHVSRDEGLSTSRFRYEFEVIPNALVMREDTEPRWQLGRYVFVKGADRVLVVSRITSWSDTATKKQRQSGDIPDIRDRMLERLWITIPHGTAVGEELDLHNLGYRFLVNYDQGNIEDEQFARPFRVLGNVRILEESETHLTVRLRVRLTTAETTAWAVFEDALKVPLMPEGRHARRASPDAVIYAVSRVGEVPFVGQRPVPISADGTVNLPEASGSVLPESNQGSSGSQESAPEATTQPADSNAQAGTADSAASGEPGELPGRWYLRTPQWETYLQLNEDKTFIQMASRPQGTPLVIRGDWAMRSGYLVLTLRNYSMGSVNQNVAGGGEGQYAILQVNWVNPHTFTLDGALPGLGASREGYRFRRAIYPDLNGVPTLSYQPGSPEPAYVGEEPKPATPAAAGEENK